ncbi:type II toxin-antitoxin system CcdA family antitoxin [Pantoea sp. RRHST58]|uniref:type II toxin-antitoxin system CcdA family antitoxin n=1 Tax=Pantoea sp. RRHST58 TaxID=3425183 RepID=UPI003DA002BB
MSTTWSRSCWSCRTRWKTWRARRGGCWAKANQSKKERGGRQRREPSVAASPQQWRQANAAALAGLNRITEAYGLLSDQHLQF